MTYSRRQFLHLATASGCCVIAACAGLLTPEQVFAEWVEDNFAPGKLEQTLDRLFAGADIADSSAISLDLPLIAEDGAVVPIKVASTLSDIESIAILVEKNPVPLAAIFTLSENTEPFVSAQLKMAETCDVIAVIKAGDKLYSARQQVKVTIGGCGG